MLRPNSPSGASRSESSRIGVAPLPLLQGPDQGVHLALGFLVLQIQQHTGLNEHQLGCHGDELAGNLQIHPLALFQIRLVLLQDQRDGDVLYLYFIFSQQVQYQIERPLEILQRLVAPCLYHLFQLENRIVQIYTSKPTSLQSMVNVQRMALSSALLPMPTDMTITSTSIPKRS